MRSQPSSQLLGVVFGEIERRIVVSWRGVRHGPSLPQKCRTSLFASDAVSVSIELVFVRTNHGNRTGKSRSVPVSIPAVHVGPEVGDAGRIPVVTSNRCIRSWSSILALRWERLGFRCWFQGRGFWWNDRFCNDRLTRDGG